MDGLKHCNICCEEKFLNAFYKNCRSKDKLSSYCKDCDKEMHKRWYENNKDIVKQKNRDYHHKNKDRIKIKKKVYIKENLNKISQRQWEWRINKKFGLTIEDYNKFLEKQNHVCAICRELSDRLTSTGESYKYDIDHNHETGEVRGLLCGKCNKALGLFNDNIDILTHAINYLKENKSEIRI